MRLKIVNTPDIDNNGISQKTKDMLVAAFAQDDSIVLTDENPDVLHVIGAWNASSAKTAADAVKRFVALVHTPLGSLSPWYRPTASYMKLSSRATATVASGRMEHELLSGQEMCNLCLVLNAVTTATTTPAEMASGYRETYREATEKNDVTLWNEVNRRIGLLKEKDTAIQEICKNILYAQYLYRRRNIPHKFLDKLSTLMTDSNYNEDTMTEVLRLIKLDVFAQHLEYVMMEKSGLTEGFMPIIYKKDKVSEKMLDLVTEY